MTTRNSPGAARSQHAWTLVWALALWGAASGCDLLSHARAIADELSPEISEVTSGSVALAWPAVRGATAIRVIVGAEPPTERGLTGAKRIATLDGDAVGTTLPRLPPNVDVFIRLEADTPRGLSVAHLAAHTAAGPRGEGAPVVSVSAIAPHILCVTLRNGTGRVWGRRGWSVRRRDGHTIAVRAVHRHSIPVGQPGYEVGFGRDDDLSRVEVDHRIYLELAEPIGSPEVLTIEGPEQAHIMLPFSDRYLETPVVQLNQVGYSPRSRARYAYLSEWMGDGGALDLHALGDEAVVLRMGARPMDERVPVGAPLAIRPRVEDDEDSGTDVYEIDLSSVPADDDATYRVRVPGVGVSYPTHVSEAAVFEAFYVTARGLFHNRWGGDLDPRYTDHPRAPDHRFVYVREQQDAFTFFPQGTRAGGRRLELRGGYHDAGDFDQRPMHTVVPQLLLRAYESSPTVFTDRQLRLPESGDGIPDLLDEALWGVAGWETLQARDGGVRAGVESTRHPYGIYSADQDELEYFTFSRDPQVSMRVAGVFAQAAWELRELDAARSRALRRRAERAYAWAAAHGARDAYRLYGAGELYRLTGEARYKTAFEEAWRRIGPYGAFSNFTDRHNFQSDYARGGQVMPDYILGYLLGPEPDPELLATARQWLGRKADEVAANILRSTHGHRNARPRGRPVAWGQGTVMGRYLDPIFARLALGELPESDRQRYFDATSVAADYVLGANPLGMVFITGLGTVSPREPLHLDSLVSIRSGHGPMPGIPVYGPVEDLPRADYYRFARVAFHPDFEQHPLMRRYADVRSFVVTNECTIWECQAPHTEHFAALVERTRTPTR